MVIWDSDYRDPANKKPVQASETVDLFVVQSDCGEGWHSDSPVTSLERARSDIEDEKGWDEHYQRTSIYRIIKLTGTVVSEGES